MKLKHLIGTAGLSALAVAIAAASPAQAAGRDHGQHGSSANRGNDQRAARVENRGDQRAARVENRGNQRAAHVERQGDRAASRAVANGNPARAAQINRSSERTAARVDRSSEHRATRIDQRTDNRAARVATRDNRTSPQRETSYTTRNRNGTYNGQRHDNDRGRWDNHGNNNGHGNHNQWNHNWRNDHRYDWHGYRNSHRSVYHLGNYYSPYRSWSYRPLSIGFYLEPLFYSSRYWIDDPYQYRLPDAYGAYHWVRYYNDALLVDIYSGEVVDVIPNFFW